MGYWLENLIEQKLGLLYSLKMSGLGGEKREHVTTTIVSEHPNPVKRCALTYLYVYNLFSDTALEMYHFYLEKKMQGDWPE